MSNNNPQQQQHSWEDASPSNWPQQPPQQIFPPPRQQPSHWQPLPPVQNWQTTQPQPPLSTSAWQAPPPPPSSSWQQPPPPHQQQPQQPYWQPPQQPQVSLWSPPVNDPLLQAGSTFVSQQMATQFTMASGQYTSYFAHAKLHYFNVNNRFVLQKLKTLLFPFLKRDWTRMDNSQFKDDNAPDLYIPLMGLVSYVLVVALAKGVMVSFGGEFNPEVIVEVFGSSVFLHACQLVLMRAALYLLVGPQFHMAWLDLLAISGYQYVGVTLNMLMGVLFGHVMYLVSLAWTCVCAFWTMFHTLQAVLVSANGGEEDGKVTRGGKKFNFLLVCGLVQVLLMWFMGFTRELRMAANAVSTLPSMESVGDTSGFAAPQNSGLPKQAGIPISEVVKPTISKTTTTATAAAGGEEGDDDYEEIVRIRKAKRKAKKAAAGGGSKASEPQDV